MTDFFTNGDMAQKAVDKYLPGYQMGTGAAASAKNAQLQAPNMLRPDQSNAERIVEQRGNYMYGGTMTGRQDAIDATRSNMAQYPGQLSAMGNNFYGQGMNAAGRQAPIAQGYLNADLRGQAGQYGTADALMQFAGGATMGPSQAQAQLEASTNDAMRAQLAMAGSGRGAGGSAAAFRQAAMNNATLQGQANANAAVLRAQEQDAFLQRQLAAYQAAGNAYGQGRAGDMAAAGYYSGTNMQQTGLNDQLAMGMGGLASDALDRAGQMQMGTEQQVHQINQGALTGNMGYEANMTSNLAAHLGAQQQQGIDPYVGLLFQGASAVLPYIDVAPDGGGGGGGGGR